MKKILFIALSFFVPTSGYAQLLGITGANHPELEWHELQTDHFVLVYHQGLDSVVREAAPIAEEVYHVVTTNLQTPLKDKVRIYFSNNDEVRNAFAFSDDYIFVWMRGILDDNLFGLRASGTSKWLRSVLTHEFTHTVIAHATKDWLGFIMPLGNVPRWFNEGMARYMEPDGWTTDLDIPLRVAAVSSKLHLGPEDFLSGTLMYEGGQSLVRHIAVKYGDSSLVKILKYLSGIGLYDFDDAVSHVTKHSLSDLYAEWHKTLNVYYNTQYGQKEDIEDIARKIPTGLNIVGAARLAPAGDKIAVLGKSDYEQPTKLYLIENDSNGKHEVLTDEQGVEPSLSWSPDGKNLLFSKIRFGEHGDLIYDLYRLNVPTRELDRLSSDAHLEYPEYSPDGRSIVAVKFRRSGSDLVLLDENGLNERALTTFNDDNVEVYSPRWSPDAKHIAFSIFRKNGMRDVAMVDPALPGSTAPQNAIHYVTNDSINDRYPIWPPNNDSLLFLSFENGLPNLYVASTHASARSFRQVSDVASNILAWDWPPKKDSILVTSFTSRNEVGLYWLAADRRVASAPMPGLAKKYTAWREVHWPLVTRTSDSLPPATAVGPYEYNSLAHLHSLITLPFIASDLSRDGSTGIQWGGLTVFADELQKHIVEGYALYGDVSKRISYGIEYQNNQLQPSILVGAYDAIEFRDVIQDQSYYEHRKRYHLDLDFALHTPNSLTNVHNILVGAEWFDLDPWNAIEFQSIDADKRPIAARLLQLGGGYTYISDHLQFGVGAEHFDKKVASDLTRTRAHLSATLELPLDEDEHSTFSLSAHGTADFGDELPQDFLGFHKYDDFEGGFNLAGIHTRERLRGIRRYYYGNRLVLGSAELSQQDKLISPMLPLLAAFAPQLVEFFDIGTTWYANAPTNHPDVVVANPTKNDWLTSAGVELRSDLGLGFAMEGGVGWELVRNPPPDWFFRIRSAF